MRDVPAWTFLLLGLASFRFWKVIGDDKVFDRPREWLLQRMPNEETALLFLLCPWCSGFWICGVALGLYCILFGWLGAFAFLVTWFALSAFVGLLGLATNILQELDHRLSK